MGKQREGGHNSLTYTQGIDTISLNSLLILNHDEGRRLKTKLRLGCHPLRSSAARMSLTRKERCLSLLWPRIRDDYAHYFECPKLDDIRGDFSQKLETILPETRNTTNADCLALLMGDDPPQEIENLLYRFLTSLFRRRLGILAAQGEGL